MDPDSLLLQQATQYANDLRQALPPSTTTTTHDDATLLRFMIARNFNTAKAAEMLLACQEWRSSKSLDDLPMPPNAPVPVPVRGFRSVPDSNPPTEPPQGVDQPYLLPEYFYRITKYLAGGAYHGLDLKGHAIYIERLGYHNTKGLAKNVTVEEIVEWHVQGIEFHQRVLGKECTKLSSLRRRRAQDPPTAVSTDDLASSLSSLSYEEQSNGMDDVIATDSRQKFTVIFDCTGMGFHQFHMPALKMLRAITDLDQKYYPETLNKLFIVNAPGAFVRVWSIIKNWLDPRVIGKVKILGSMKEYKPALLEEISEHTLPTFLGGTCTCSHMPGGCVPSHVLDNVHPVKHTPGYAIRVPLSLPNPDGNPIASFSRSDSAVGPSHAYHFLITANDDLRNPSTGLVEIRFRTDAGAVLFETRKRRTMPAIGDEEKQSGEAKNENGEERLSDDVIILPSASHSSHLHPITLSFQAREQGEYVLIWDIPTDSTHPEPALEYVVYVDGKSTEG